MSAGLPPLTLFEAATVTGGELSAADTDAPLPPISTDSRSIRPGEAFLALRGERFDGHRFIGAAVERGAAVLIVDREHTFDGPPPAPTLRVSDTLWAYGQLAGWRRRQWGGPLLAISGSAGKTTTRRLVAAALARHMPVLEPPHNFNNLIGVPQTLLRLQRGHAVAVMELGMNQPGELRRLTDIAAPSTALLTHIGMTHVGMFRSIEELVRAKLDLFQACAAGTPLVINDGCRHSTAAAPTLAPTHPIVRFAGERPDASRPTPDVYLDRVAPLAPVGYRFDLVVRARRLAGCELRLFGRPQLENVAAAAALMLAAGYEPAWLPEALADFHTEPLRGQYLEAAGLRLILDCYNAAPDAMTGALESLGDVPHAGRRILVLADMLELGAQTRAGHEMLLAPLRALAPDALYGLGPETARIAGILEAEGLNAYGFESRDQLADCLRGAVHEGDLVFFKGSHGFGLEHVAQALAPEAGIVPDHT